jgi:hypothetical protein
MYFRNSNTNAVTDKDMSLLFGVCTILKTQMFIQNQMWRTNSKWAFRAVNCHSVTRFISLLFQELKVIDGTLVGLEINLDAGQVKTKKTNHSWLETPDGNIIDPYPMGVIATTGAILVPSSGTDYIIHAGNLYQKDLKIDGEFALTEAWRVARSRYRTTQKYI